MKTIYKSTLLLALGCFTLSMNAQKDTTYNRQVMLERDYNPTLKDASKINTTPAIYEPTITNKKDARFLDQSPKVSLNTNLLGVAKSGDIKTGVDFDKKRGYLGLGAGSNSNIEGVAGIRILNLDNDQLDLFANHSSTSGNVDYLEKGYWFKEAKAKYSDTKVSLKYAHTFDPSILSFHTSYFNTSYNYYGNSFSLPGVDPDPYPFDMNARQSANVFAIGTKLRSSDNNRGLLKYMLSLDYKNFKNKYGPEIGDKGIKGGQFDLGVDLNTEFDSDKILGIKGGLMNQSISDVKFVSLPDGFHSFTNITVSPYFNFIGESWDASLGLNVNGAFDVKTKFHFTPNLSAGVNVTENSRFYASIGGGINNNTVLDILQENRYVNLDSRIAYSKTIYDATIGFKSGDLTGFEFDIFGGYKKTNDDHLYAAVSDITNSWGNLSTPLYADVSTGHAGGLIKTNLIPYTELSAKAVGYFYKVKYQGGTISLPAEDKAWGRPSFTAELNADVKVIPQFTFSLNYLYAGGRKAFLDIRGRQSSAKMKDINELNLRAEYQITNWAAVYVKANNMLFQKYEHVYGYAMQGGNFMGGLNFKF